MRGSLSRHAPSAVAGALLVLALAGSTGGCAVTVDPYPDLRPEPSYDALYPYYIELAAVSQIQPVDAPEGGTAGHAVMYLKGAAVDLEAEYPRLVLCDPATADLSDPETGVGVSVNKVFSNVNWTAVRGRALFFDGDVEHGEVVDASAEQTVVAEAVEAGVWRGIEIHEPDPDSEDFGKPDFEVLTTSSIGTDVALRFGRAVFSARMPVTRRQLGDVIDYLNALNDTYARTDEQYEWNGLNDNCAHALHNALAAAAIWKPRRVGTTRLRQLFNVAVPSNEMISLAVRGNAFPLEEVERVVNDPSMRRALIEYGRLPVQHGVLLSYLGPHRNNELYYTDQHILVIELPLIRSRSRRVKAMMEDANFTRVVDNLRYFEERYETILEARPADWNDREERSEKDLARRLYYLVLEAQLEDVRRKLASLPTEAPPRRREPVQALPDPR